MINSKNRNGFTLVEVLVALLMMGLMLGALFMSESLVVRSVSVFSQQLRRIFYAKKFMYQTQKERKKTEDKTEAAGKEEFIKEAGFTTHLLFEESPSTINALKNYKDIMIDRVKIEWQEHARRRNDELVTFVFKQKKSKKKE